MFTSQEMEFIARVLSELQWPTKAVQEHIMAATIVQKIGASMQEQTPEGPDDAAKDAEGNG